MFSSIFHELKGVEYFKEITDFKKLKEGKRLKSLQKVEA